jgi:hypothetical protein
MQKSAQKSRARYGLLKPDKNHRKMRQMKNLKIFSWCSRIAWKMGEEIQGLDPGLLQPGKIQGLDPCLLTTKNTNSGVLLSYIMHMLPSLECNITGLILAYSFLLLPSKCTVN